MKKILITGGTGFVGTAVVEALESYDVELHILSRVDYSHFDTEKKKYHKISLMQFKDIDRLLSSLKADYLIHLAWYVNPMDYLDSDKNLLWVSATLNIISSFVRNGGVRLVATGTCFEYAFNEDIVDEETTPICPLSLYAQCKASTYEILKKYLRDNNISYVWARLGYMYGENEYENRVVPYIIKNLLRDKEVICKNSSAIRDYIYVKDVGSSLVEVLFSEYIGPLNIATGKKVMMRQLFKEIARQLNKENLVIYIDEPVMPKSMVMNVTRLKSIRSKYSTKLSEGINETIKWWKSKYDMDTEL
ncbi:NAD-dependent epimerase/dehydratase family protein [Aminipila sp.]|uniref:NAD-dependent epimerase/dehydratase family protein n=1 Tax=Aminipila sp. TaxID=2060095 RepID=UPI00289B444A|nr:NAD(P)-dependent oxidoreductase [Aminipila sp.]